jgi:hypothetical protein
MLEKLLYVSGHKSIEKIPDKNFFLKKITNNLHNQKKAFTFGRK